MTLVLTGCSEWNLRSLIGSNALGPDTGHTGLDDPLSRGDTAPPDDMRPGAGLPTHCNPPDDPTMTPVWNPGEAPPMHSLSGNFDFDSQGRALWVRSGTLSWVDRSGTSGRMDTEWNYPYDATIRVLPNGGVVVSGEGRLDVRDPDAGVTLRSIHENLGDRRRQHDTIEVDTENHFYTEYESGSVLRVDSTVGGAQRVVDTYWPPQLGRELPLHFALTPDENILYVLEHGRAIQLFDTRLYRIDRHEGGWRAPELIWEDADEPTNVRTGLAVDECGNAIVLLTKNTSMTLWYVPLEGDVRQLLHANDFWATHMQWGNGRFGWDASTLYLWGNGPEGLGLYKLDLGVKGNHVLTR